MCLFLGKSLFYWYVYTLYATLSYKHNISYKSINSISKNYLAPGESMDEKFGTAEEKMAKGMCDLVLERHKLKPTICTLAKIIKKKQNLAAINENFENSAEHTSREILQKTAEKI